MTDDELMALKLTDDLQETRRQQAWDEEPEPRESHEKIEERAFRRREARHINGGGW